MSDERIKEVKEKLSRKFHLVTVKEFIKYLKDPLFNEFDDLMISIISDSDGDHKMALSSYDNNILLISKADMSERGDVSDTEIIELCNLSFSPTHYLADKLSYYPEDVTICLCNSKKDEDISTFYTYFKDDDEKDKLYFSLDPKVNDGDKELLTFREDIYAFSEMHYNVRLMKDILGQCSRMLSNGGKKYDNIFIDTGKDGIGFDYANGSVLSLVFVNSEEFTTSDLGGYYSSKKLTYSQLDRILDSMPLDTSVRMYNENLAELYVTLVKDTIKIRTNESLSKKDKVGVILNINTNINIAADKILEFYRFLFGNEEILHIKTIFSKNYVAKVEGYTLKISDNYTGVSSPGEKVISKLEDLILLILALKGMDHGGYPIEFNGSRKFKISTVDNGLSLSFSEMAISL